MSSSSVRILCYCNGRCGGPDGAGKLWTVGTVSKHKKADRDTVEAARHAQVIAATGNSTNPPALSTSRERSHQPIGRVGARDSEGAEIRTGLDDGDGAERNLDGSLLMGGEMVRLLIICNMFITDLWSLGWGWTDL